MRDARAPSSRRSGTPTSCTSDAGRAGAAVRRPAPGARGHVAAGVRGTAARRAAGAAARAARWPRWTTTSPPATGTCRSPTRSRPSRCATLVRNAREFGIELFDLDSPGAGHRARHRPRARGSRSPGMIDRLRRLAHLHPRRVRRAGVRDRDQRGGARARDPVHRAARPRTMEVRFEGAPPPGVTAKDLILALIGRIGTAGATGHVSSTRGEAIRALSMEGRMTVCNMSIEAGARAGMIAPDDTTFAYLEGAAARAEGRGVGRARSSGGAALAPIPAPRTTARSSIDASSLAPAGHLGHQPGHDGGDHRARARSRRRAVRGRAAVATSARSSTWACGRATPLEGLKVDRVFLGSCTNARHRGSARGGQRGRAGARWRAASGRWWCPGSQRVKARPRREGLDRDLHARRASSGAIRAARCASA